MCTNNMVYWATPGPQYAWAAPKPAYPKPADDKLLVRRSAKNENALKGVSGCQEFEVIRIGDCVDVCEAGHQILCSFFAGIQITWHGEKLEIIDEENVIAIL